MIIKVCSGCNILLCRGLYDICYCLSPTAESKHCGHTHQQKPSKQEFPDQKIDFQWSVDMVYWRWFLCHLLTRLCSGQTFLLVGPNYEEWYIFNKLICFVDKPDRYVVGTCMATKSSMSCVRERVRFCWWQVRQIVSYICIYL